MPRKRPGFGRLQMEFHEAIIDELYRRSEEFPSQSKACSVGLLLNDLLGLKLTHETICPPLGRRPKPVPRKPGRPPATPPKPAKGRRKG